MSGGIVAHHFKLLPQQRHELGFDTDYTIGITPDLLNSLWIDAVTSYAAPSLTPYGRPLQRAA